MVQFFWNRRVFLCGVVLGTTLSGCSTLFAKKSSSDLPSNIASIANVANVDGADDSEAREETPVELEVEVRQERSQAEIDADLESRKTFPLVYNEMVEVWIRFFTSKRGQPVMQRWLERSTRFMPLMQQVMRDHGLPEDLVYLAMIESGFNLKAKSHAKAVGPWQFIPSTGKRYNLNIDYWIDERRDVRKSSIAAATYLRELHLIFGSWYLAAASYNAGEGRVLNAVRRDRTRNFWELARKKSNFRAETRNYVPKIIAAALISKNPERYGFTNINFMEPLAWEIFRVPNGVSLKDVARVINYDDGDLHIMNSELRRGITPPGSEGYDLRIPRGRSQILAQNLHTIEAKKIGNFLEHSIRRGDTISSIARKYGVDQQSVIDLNKISNTRALRLGQELLIPVGGGDESPRRRARINKSPVAKLDTFAPAPAAPLAANEYQVQPGDTLWGIAQRFKVSVADLKTANRLRSARSLQVGQRIRVPKSEESSVKVEPSSSLRRGFPQADDQVFGGR